MLSVTNTLTQRVTQHKFQVLVFLCVLRVLCGETPFLG